MSGYNVGYFVGSPRQGVDQSKLALALVRLAPKELSLKEIPFVDSPLYNYDYDANFPPVARALKDAIAAVDAVLFVTPEYNRSIPGGLKNAIDWQVVRTAKTHSRVSLGRHRHIARKNRNSRGPAAPSQHLGVCKLATNEFIEHIPFTPGLISDNGEVTDDSVARFLRDYMANSMDSSRGSTQRCLEA
jgi:chromate reductase